MGYDFVPGALAGALALEEAGADAVRVDVGYYALGDGRERCSAGTRESLVGATLDDSHAFRDGRVRIVRPAERVRSFAVDGKRPRGDVGRRRGALRRCRPPIRGCARSTSTSAGSGRWRGRCRPARWSGSVARASRACAER